ncbi:glycosyltransferase family 2 protein [Bauldia sp.]|uniref:glycosyltransferase family 2 protein n=1 Tax=Bauldia sp. TaxID=2575872 RepID=UPI003BAC2E00
MADIAQWLRLNPTARPRVAITTPTAVRAALRQAGRHRYGAEALHRLEAIDTDVSAKRVVTGRQVSIAAALIMILVGALVAAPIATLIVIDLIAATFFLSVSLLRFAAAGRVPRRLPRPLLPARDKRDLPTYTILIPLLQEAHLVAELVEAMDAIDWPRDRLDIKLIVEEGDLPTRAAAVRLTNGTPYEVIIVPAIGPQTKPKALQYGLIFARGSFVTVFDAEDRPDPQQLREAYATFCRCEGDIACLQAPLLVDNPDASWLSRSFAVEYSGLFDGLLSALSRFRLPLPLGGTSNHFRRDVLEAVGGWDPYNVTEDADLGIRLARNGYRAATLTLPTYEEAPARLWPWIKQRSRWFKGWMQTWLVHMRHPIQLAKDLGIRQFLGFNLIGLGMIVSAIAHPIFVATPILLMRNPIGLWDQAGTLTAVVVGINIFNLIAGYLAVWVLSLRTTRLRRRFPILPALLGLPLYWLLMALACLRAAVQLVIRPHAWEKTPHVGQRGRTRRPAHPAPRRVWPAVTQPDTR